MSKPQFDINHCQRLVIKIGSSLITRDGVGLDNAAIQQWAEQAAQLIKAGKQLVVVSSGSVAEGMVRMAWQQRPQTLHELQAAAAIGQMGLIRCYEDAFQKHALHTAQLLLSHDDLANRRRYLNARSTLKTLLELNVVPIVNENDTVATEEIRFGDNDSLAAMVCNLIEADLLVILTDQQGLYDADPSHNPNAKLIEQAAVDDPKLAAMAGPSRSEFGRGGMHTKLQAARTAARSGTHTVIMSGSAQQGVLRLMQGEKQGTLLTASQSPISSRKQWLGGRLVPKGSITLDDGAVKVLTGQGRSLLPVGVTAVQGDFQRGDLVTCIDSGGKEIGRGLINYNAQEVAKIKGQASGKLQEILGYIDETELIHRDNLIITA